MQAVSGALQIVLWEGTASAPAANVTIAPPESPKPDAATPESVNVAPPPAPYANSSTMALPDRRDATAPSPLAMQTVPSSQNVGEAIGGTIGGTVALLAIAVLVVFLILRAHRRKAARPPDSTTDGQPGAATTYERERKFDSDDGNALARASATSRLGPGGMSASNRRGRTIHVSTPIDQHRSTMLSSGDGCARLSLLTDSTTASGPNQMWVEGPASTAATRRRIAPAKSMLVGSTISEFSGAVYSQPSTLEQPQERERLRTAVQNMAESEPLQLFAGRYRLKSEWVQGGQALVVFACDSANSFYQFAIKCASSPMHS